MPRKIRVRGFNQFSLPKKIGDGNLEQSALQITPPSNSEEGKICEYIHVCPDRGRCNGYGRVNTQRRTKFNKRCDSYSPGE